MKKIKQTFTIRMEFSELDSCCNVQKPLTEGDIRRAFEGWFLGIDNLKVIVE